MALHLTKDTVLNYCFAHRVNAVHAIFKSKHCHTSKVVYKVINHFIDVCNLFNETNAGLHDNNTSNVYENAFFLQYMN